MGAHIGGKKVVITTKAKNVWFTEIRWHYFVIKYNELLAEFTIKMRLIKVWPNISIETIFLNTKNSKTKEPHEFVLNLSQRVHLKSSK